MALGFDYLAPVGGPLHWRMLDVRVYRYHQPTADDQKLYTLWHVGEATYILTTAPDDEHPEAILCRLPCISPPCSNRP